jgi:putative oxidoreductase
MSDATLSAATPRLFIPKLAGLYSSLADLAQAAPRIVLGVILVAHGAQKLFGAFGGMGLAGNAALFDKIGYSPGMFWGTLVGCTEFIGGILLVIGLFVRPAAFAVTIFLINAVYFTGKTGGFFWTTRGMEFSLMLLAVAFCYLIRGAGPWSIDRKMSREF